MNRKDFLKGIFGAAVIATVPKPVMDRIEALPAKPPIEPINVDRPTTLEFVQKCKIKPKDGFFYLYDKNKLIAYGNDFNLGFEQDYMKYYTEEEYIKNKEGHLVSFLPSWTVKGYTQWEDIKEAEKYFINNDPLQILMKSNNIEFAGDVYIQGLTIDMELYKPIDGTIELVGNGALTAIFQKG